MKFYISPKLISPNKLILFILIIASLLRFIGTNPGYPPYHSDEGISYSAASSMIRNKNLDPLRYDYPSIVPLSNYLIFRLFFIPIWWAKFYLTNFGKIMDGFIHIPLSKIDYDRTFLLDILGLGDRNALFWGRYITALFSTGVVFFTYLVAKKLFGKYPALISAALVAVNFREVLNSHIGLPDIYNAFFLLIALYSYLSLWEKPNTRKYVICAVCAGLSFSTKFQFFSFLPLFLIHLDLANQKETLKKKVKFLFNKGAIFTPLIIILTFLALNPYLIIHFETFVDQITYVALKYGVASNYFVIYPYFYLFEIGIGKLTTIIVVLGIVLATIKNFKKSLFLISVVIPFFYVMTFYTGGGFYTRNFVTVTPILCIFAGYFSFFVYKFLGNILKNKLSILIFSSIFLLIISENLFNSIKSSVSYTKPWNYQTLLSWVEHNIPEGSKISAHSSVQLPANVKILGFDLNSEFTLQEFVNINADYSVANLDWATINLYWWMQGSRDSILTHSFQKPNAVLEETFDAMAIRELSDFSVYEVIKPWQAPDSNFIVSKIPKYVVIQKELREDYNFKNGLEGWSKKGKLWYEDSPLDFDNDSLVIKMVPEFSPILHWGSEAISIENWKGFDIVTSQKTETKSDNVIGAFVFVSFYKSLTDANMGTNRIAVRLSSRNRVGNTWTPQELMGKIPVGAKYMTLGFQTYNSIINADYLKEMKVYNADVEMDLSGVSLNPIRLEDNVIFPVSHGNL